VVEVDTHFNFHYANAFEDPTTGHLVIDTVRADRLELGNKCHGNDDDDKAGGGGGGGGGKKKQGKKKLPVWETVDFAKDVPMSTLWRYELDVSPLMMLNDNADGKVVDGRSSASTKTTTAAAVEVGVGDSSSENKEGLVSRRQLSSRSLDFPTINRRVSGKPHRYVWAACGASSTTASPPQGLIKIDTWAPPKASSEGEKEGEKQESGGSSSSREQVWMPAKHEFLGEPCFVRRSPTGNAERGASPADVSFLAAADDSKEEEEEVDEDDGYIVAMLADGTEGANNSLLVFDASNVAQGPVCKVDVGTNIPHGLHGCFAEDVRPNPKEVAQAEALLRLYNRKSTEWNQVDASFSGMGFGQFFGQKGVDGR
jgi:hypothetical protein